MNPSIERLPISYGNFLHAILGIYLKQQLAERLSLPERDVHVWPISAFCFQAVAFEHVEIDGIPCTRVYDNPTP